jgi:hypothetical protein
MEERKLLAENSVVEKVPSELVEDKKEIKKVEKYKILDLTTSKKYLENFINMTPKEIGDFIDKQSDILMMLSKNAAMEKLSQAVENDDHDAMEMYLKLVQASAIVADEKIKVKKAIGIDEPLKPKQYVAEKLTPEDWEKQFKPGSQPNEKQPVFIAPSNKTIN